MADSMSVPYTCPFCNRATTITSELFSRDTHIFNKGNRYGYQGIVSTVHICPNPECKEYSLSVTVNDAVQANYGYRAGDVANHSWKLVPFSSAKVFPEYVPVAIRQDYEEACSIQQLSPKACCTLARRCLQGMIRDFWGESHRTLFQEIEAIQERLDPLTWQAIDSVRSIGNIGAHMESDIDIIVDVDPNEAGLLIGLVETLISDWYLARFEREQRLNRIVGLAEAKQNQRRPDE